MAEAARPDTTKDAAYYEGRNDDLLALLPEEARRVLDVGCGAGALGAAVKAARPDAVVHGLDRQPAALAEAASRLDRVFQADLDGGLPVLDGPYDAILCGDVLEHLVDPWAALRALVAHLAPDGRLLASLPNVRHYKVVRELLFRGRFTYRARGILDATHLRFFTLHEMRALFAQAGLEVVGILPRLSGHNLFWRAADLFLGGADHELRAVQYALVGRRRSAT